MADDKDRKAYIGMERGEKSVKYLAKTFGKPPFEITRQQYNAIVKTLGAQDWRNTVEDELTIINNIICNQLKPAEAAEPVETAETEDIDEIDE
jgi:hypothetical protein